MRFLRNSLFALVLLASCRASAQSRIDSLSTYLQGSWKLEAIRYFEGKAEGISRDMQFDDQNFSLFESKNGMRKLKYKAQTRLDSLDDGIIVLYAYINEQTATSTCNTIVLHLFPEAEDTMRISFFEIYFLREEEKLNRYIANYRCTRIAD